MYAIIYVYIMYAIIFTCICYIQYRKQLTKHFASKFECNRSTNCFRYCIYVPYNKMTSYSYFIYCLFVPLSTIYLSIYYLSIYLSIWLAFYDSYYCIYCLV
jgi:hypothetical protein